MNTKRNTASVMAVMLGASALLAACGGGSPAPGGSSSTAKTPASPVKIEAIRNGAALPAPDADPIKKELDKALGIDLNLSVYTTSADYTNQINVRMASGNVPDLIWVSKDLLNSFASKNLLLDLTPYYEKELKQTKDWLGPETMRLGLAYGKNYGIPNPNQFVYSTYWIRKDWLDQLGLKMPGTPEELLNVMKAFTEKDPDGNGKKDTYGLTGVGFNTFAPVLGAYGVGLPHDFYIRDNKLLNSFTDPNMKDALAFIKKLVDSGGVDRELFSNSGAPVIQQKAYQGQAGIVQINWSDFAKDEHIEKIKAANPKAQWVQVPALKGPGGQFDGSWQIGTTNQMFAIPKGVEKNPEKLKKVFDLINYVSSKDGSMLVQYGVKGVHYNLDNGKVVKTDKLNDIGYVWDYQFTGRPDEFEYLRVRFPSSEKAIEFAKNQPRIQALNGFVDFPTGYNHADASRYTQEELVKFIYGKRPLEEYDAFVKALMDNFKYKSYMDEAQKTITGLGLLK
ncbi:extracellular solute-binding protein [Paenibacillus thalictri]|uniref:Extracellular solute-binding protein n=2 Tax=Paenibacillus thalictri TaxID=2527873 RepID=A0A4Q9DJW6_9BACL|nr:extracellular solute-binding protein [Paenibacillus thalictri]